MIRPAIVPILLLAVICADAADYRAQVVRSTDRQPIEGVEITASSVSQPGQVTAKTRSGPFGFLTLSGLPSGDYTLSFSHPAFAPAQAPLTLPVPPGASRTHVLTQLVTGSFDLYVQVLGAVGGVSLSAVPVRVERFAEAGGSTLLEARTASTDTNGFTVIRGVTPGFYRFHANRAADGAPKLRWLAFSSTNLAQLSQSHSVNIQLKPDPQDLTVEVRGFDPAKPPDGAPNQPLANIYVELTGLNPADHDQVLVKARTGVTDFRGEVTFHDLAPFAWRIRARRMGYRTNEVILQPDPANGGLLAPDSRRTIFVTMTGTRLVTRIDSIYQSRSIFDPFFFTDIGNFHDGLPVALAGYPHSNTDGILRTNRVKFDAARSAPVVEFANLLPGRYRIQALPELLTAPSNAPSIQVLDRLDFQLNPAFRFQGRADVSVIDDATNVVDLTVRPQPAVVRGRLFFADGISDDVGPLPGNSGEERLGEPIYRLKAAAGIEFRDMDVFSNLLPDTFAVVTETDAGGEFVVELPPGVYGVKIPGLTNYLGVRSVFSQVTPAGETLLGEQGWPYVDIARILSPPNDQEARGFPVSSGGEYRLDLYVNRHAANYLGDVNVDSAQAEPTTGCVTAIIAQPGTSSEAVTIPYSDLLTAGTARAVDVASGNTITGRLFRSPVTGNLRIGFRELPEGAYDLQVVHPRYTSTVVRFTTPDWRAPGELPVQTAGITPFQTPALSTFGESGASTSGGPTVTFAAQPVTFDILEWRDVLENGTNVMKYVPVSSNSTPAGFFTVDYAPGLLFHGNLRFQAGSGFRFWIEFLVTDNAGNSLRRYFTRSTSNVFHHVVFIGGPSENLSASGPVAPPLPLTLRARSAADESMPVPGTSVTLPTVVGSALVNQSYATDQTIPGYRGRITVAGVQNTNGWTLDTSRPVRVIPGNKQTGEATIVTVFLRRRLDVRGTIVSTANTNQAIGGAAVVLYNRFGRRIAATNTDTNGFFGFTNAVDTAQPVFLQADAPGFKPVRRRFAGSFDDTPGAPLVLQTQLALEPLPAPVIVPSSMSLNRAGLFLPGVTRAGNASAFNAFNATNALTLRWSFQATVPRIQYPLDAFDDTNGPRGTITVNVEDQPDRAWFIDARTFPADPLRSNVLSNPFQIDTNGNSPTLRTQLREIVRATNTAPFFVRSERFTNTATLPAAIAVATTNTLSIPDLPPGVIRPVMALSTRRGAVAAREFAYINEFAGKELKGLRTPPWMAGFADILGFTAGLQATLTETDAKKEALKSVLPEGLLVPLPAFKADIAADAAGFLSYKYAMEVSMKDGEDSPSEGLMALGLGRMGVEAKGTLNLELDGAKDTVKLAATAQAGNPDGLDLTEYLPRILPKSVRKKFNPGSLKARINVNSSFNLEDTIGNSGLSDKLVIQSAHGGFVGLELAFDLKPYATKIPYVGPVLLLVDQVYGTNFVIDAKVDGGVGAGRNLVWTTQYPRQFESPPPGSSIDPALVIPPNRKVMRRHFLGGTEEPNIAGTNTFGSTNFICFTLGVGFDVKAGSRAGASGRLGITGVNCPVVGAPSAAIELNSLGSWPVIRRVSGQMEAQFKAFLDLGIRKYEKEYKWNFLPFDYQFGTDPYFRLAPLDISLTTFDPATFPAATFQSTGPVLLTNLFPAALPSAPAGALAFADPLPGGAGMAVRVSIRNPDGTRAPPVTLATAGGVMDVQAVALSDGEWLVAWVELDAGQLTNPFPPTRVRWAVSSQSGSMWSAPMTLAAHADTVSGLHLVASAAFTGAAWLHTSEGPTARLFSLSTAIWNGAGWTAPSVILSNAPIADLTLTASPASPGGLIGYRRTGSDAVARRWSATGTGPELTMTNASLRLFGFATDPAGTHYAATAGPGGLSMFQLTASGAAWTPVGNPLPLSPVDHVALFAPVAGTLQMAWIPRLNRNQIWSVELDSTGAFRSPFIRHVQLAETTELTLLRADFSTPSFLVRMTDANGVSVENLPGLPASATRITLHPQGRTAAGFEIAVTGPEGIGARAQFSPDLLQWADLGAFDLGTNAVRIIDQGVTGATARFYRVLMENP